VQETAADGTVTSTSIFPAWYGGRWPHIHWELCPSLASATAGANKISTSKIALPEESFSVADATPAYKRSLSTLSRVSLSSDNVFRDGWTSRLGHGVG